MRYIFVGLDGAMAFGLMLLVRASTGVRYGVQCGEEHDLQVAEGYLIPLGDDRDAAVLRNMFVKFPYGFESQESLRYLRDVDQSVGHASHDFVAIHSGCQAMPDLVLCLTFRDSRNKRFVYRKMLGTDRDTHYQWSARSGPYVCMSFTEG